MNPINMNRWMPTIIEDDEIGFDPPSPHPIVKHDLFFFNVEFRCIVEDTRITSSFLLEYPLDNFIVKDSHKVIGYVVSGVYYQVYHFY